MKLQVKKLDDGINSLLFEVEENPSFKTFSQVMPNKHAQLFAAAPEMLALLGNILSHFKGRKDADFSDCYGYLKQDMEDMIKKATGK